jgi:putative oxidoreductase
VHEICLFLEVFVKFLGSFQPLGLLGLRIALGVIFFTHGYPKLTRSAAAMQAMFVQHGLPAQLVYVAGVLETFAGVLLILGLFTRPAALLLAIEMAVAIVKVHSGHGIMALREYEFPLVLGTACAALATVGAGLVSADNFLIGEGNARRTGAARPAKK